MFALIFQLNQRTFTLKSPYQKQVCITIEHYSANENKSSFTVLNLTKILFSRQEYLVQMIISAIDLEY